jgi:hypothetical protein
VFLIGNAHNPPSAAVINQFRKYLLKARPHPFLSDFHLPGIAEDGDGKDRCKPSFDPFFGHTLGRLRNHEG